MLMDTYFLKMRETLDKIEKTQRENVIKAADMAVESLINDGMFHVYDTGHMLMFEGVGRTGGLMSLRPVKIECTVNNPTRFRDRGGVQKLTYDKVDGFAQFVLGQMNLKKGDT
ncbi:MAG: SIS domain-containing protein, partial [Clostridia bacterium]